MYKVLSSASQSIQQDNSAAGQAPHLHIVLRDCGGTNEEEVEVRERLFEREDDEDGAAQSRNTIRTDLQVGLYVCIVVRASPKGQRMRTAEHIRNHVQPPTRFLTASDLQGAFQSITITCLPPPSTDTRVLDTGGLRGDGVTDEFARGIGQLGSKITSQLRQPPRTLAGQPLTCKAMPGLLRALVQAVNDKRGKLVPHSLYEDYQRAEGLQVKEQHLYLARFPGRPLRGKGALA